MKVGQSSDFFELQEEVYQSKSGLRALQLSLGLLAGNFPWWKSLTTQEHRSIPCSVMRYISFLLLLFVLAGAGRAYSQQQRIEDPCPPISVTCPDTDTGSTLDRKSVV